MKEKTTKQIYQEINERLKDIYSRFWDLKQDITGDIKSLKLEVIQKLNLINTKANAILWAMFLLMLSHGLFIGFFWHVILSRAKR